MGECGSQEVLNHSTRIKKYSKYKDAQFSSRAALHPLMGSDSKVSETVIREDRLQSMTWERYNLTEVEDRRGGLRELEIAKICTHFYLEDDEELHKMILRSPFTASFACNHRIIAIGGCILVAACLYWLSNRTR